MNHTHKSKPVVRHNEVLFCPLTNLIGFTFRKPPSSDLKKKKKKSTALSPTITSFPAFILLGPVSMLKEVSPATHLWEAHRHFLDFLDRDLVFMLALTPKVVALQ